MLWEILAFIIALTVSVPLFIVASQCLVALCVNPKNTLDASQKADNASYKILMPAHNEASIIQKTLKHLLNELPNNDPKNLILIADNCTDNTADLARTMGVTVLERNNVNQRGKGFALDFGIQYLRDHDKPDILLILDADCETSKVALQNLIATASSRKLPAQMVYLMRVVNQNSIKQKIAGFAWLLKNKIRLLAMNSLGLPVILTGTGMAFPWQALECVRLGNSNIVEDMQLGIDCSIAGFPPVLCPDALVYSDFPEQNAAELSQRTRWEHGHLQTIINQVPLLTKEALRQKSYRLLALALDIGVPPLTLLIMLTLGGLAALSTLSLLTAETAALKVLATNFVYFFVLLTAAWWKFGRQLLTARELLGVPWYVISKLSIYLGFISKRQKAWVKTERDS